MDKVPALLVAVGSVTAAQLIGGKSSPTPNHPRTAAWYARLRKPSFTPPGPVFGLAWTGLDVLLGYAGYRLLVARPSSSRTAALGFWGLNVLTVGGFSWVLFGRKRLDEAAGVSAGMVLTSTSLAATASLVDKRAARAVLPLVGWVVFATVLQGEVWRKNK